MKKQISEEINSMKFLLNYKRGVVISEQVNQQTPEQKIVNDIISARDSAFGTNEKGIVDAIKSIKSVTQLKQIDDILKSTGAKLGIAATINNEMGMGDIPMVREIETHLKQIGADFTSNLNPKAKEGEYSGGFEIRYNTTSTPTKVTTSNWSKYPCVPKHPQAKKGKTAKGSEYYQINNYYYYDNGRKYEISTKKVTNYTCNDPEFKVNISTPNNMANNTVNQKTPIPSELKNIEGVKLFQDWLDVNAQGWATGFANGILNKSAGYGNFGRRTKKAWTLYGKEYLQSLNTPVENEKESPFMKSQLEKIKSEKPNPAFTAPIQKVGTPLQSAQNPAPTVNQGLGQLKRQ